MKIRRRSTRAPRIDTTPLMDVVFLLLVFFIYAMLSMTVQHGQTVELPRSEAVTPVRRADTVSVSVRSADDGVRLFIDDEPVDARSLEGLVIQMIGKREDGGDKEVVVLADGSIPYQELFRVLDMIKRAGVARISLLAEPGGRHDE